MKDEGYKSYAVEHKRMGSHPTPSPSPHAERGE